MKVAALERLDQNTIRCKVSWTSEASRDVLSVLVTVPASIDEVASPIDRFELPADVIERAVDRATDVSLGFASQVMTGNPRGLATPAAPAPLWA